MRIKIKNILSSVYLCILAKFSSSKCVIRGLACIIILIGTAISEQPNAQDLEGFTKPLPELQVFLTWQPDTTEENIRYNIYRKLAADTDYPVIPINSSPIEPITVCADFMFYIPAGSDEWNILANAFADSLSGTPLADVCSVTSYPKDSEQWEKALLLTRVKSNIAIVFGVGFRDAACINGNQYNYRIHRVNELGEELPLTGENEITITAGIPEPVPSAENVRIVIGDAMLQVLWNKPASRYAAFNLYRSLAIAGPFRKVNDADISVDITVDIDSNNVIPLSNGFTDYERWDSLGYPAPRTVPGNFIPFTGPSNGTTYYYKVKLKDILGNESPFSDVVSGVPVDRTPPATPYGVIVTPVESNSSFEIKFPTVLKDVDGHLEKMGSYKVYRYTEPENPNSGATLLPGDVIHPQAMDSITYLFKTDNSPGLRSDCGEKTFYFRVEAIDEQGNISQRSVAVGNALKDTTKPPLPKGTSADGFDDFIRVKWLVSEYCDTNTYLIYRALCDYGEWVPCPTARISIGEKEKRRPPDGSAYQPDTLQAQIHEVKRDTIFQAQFHKRRDCGGPFVLIGVLPHWEARKRASNDTTYFDDMTVPEGSPLCYAYLVKAQDLSQNISGELPLPDLNKEIVVCQRLRDKTPPQPGIISGLLARDDSIVVEYIGPPVQDIAAYHIFRSENDEFGTYNWVGGMTVVPPPSVGTSLDSPFTPQPVVDCGVIPLISKEYMSAGTFVDKKVKPKQIYWYKILGVDQNGNQTSVDSAVGISTFTFKTEREKAPEITSITAIDEPCALDISWNETFNPETMMGFVVFRARKIQGPYYQINNIIKTNSYSDNSIARNTEYWYRIAILKKDGSMTNLSEPKNSTHP